MNPTRSEHPSSIGLRLDAHLLLPEGPRVRLRLPRMRDQILVRKLLGRMGVSAGELEVRRALRFDPATRTVVCATLWAPAGEVMVGLAASARDGGADMLIGDEHLAPGIGAALADLLTSPGPVAA